MVFQRAQLVGRSYQCIDSFQNFFRKLTEQKFQSELTFIGSLNSPILPEHIIYI